LEETIDFGFTGSLPLNVTCPAGFGTVNQAYSSSPSVIGGTTPYTYSSSGLPPGLTMSSAGAITGQPMAAGTYSTTITVNGSNFTCPIAIAPPPVGLSCPTINAGAVNTSLTTNLRPSGGISAYSSPICPGSLPPGLSLTPS